MSYKIIVINEKGPLKFVKNNYFSWPSKTDSKLYFIKAIIDALYDQNILPFLYKTQSEIFHFCTKPIDDQSENFEKISNWFRRYDHIAEEVIIRKSYFTHMCVV